MIIIEFNDLKNRNELADFLKIPRHVLTYILYIKKVEHLYTSFDIPKKSGGVRSINAPVFALKSIQKELATALWEHQQNIRKNNSIKSNISHAFEKEKSIITNARIHKNKRYVLNVDLEDFFDSFNFGRVRGFFEKNKYFQLPIELATVIAQLTCYEGSLPQGAPTSPIITNLICNILDFKLLSISKKYKLDYTRYADDLTFSTNDKYLIEKLPNLFIELNKQIEVSGFKINTSKTRLQYRDSRQVVTGLVVNEKVSVNRDFYKKTRAMAHSLYTTGKFEIDGNLGTLNQLEGRFNFINQIDWYNNKKYKECKQKSYMNTFNSREKEYQKFLFYRYFFSNNKPLIITEGKTDIKYLQAALKNMYQEYPNLIKKENGEFSFKVSFLKRSKRIKYFFALETGGADSTKNIYNLYNGTNSFTNYWKYFTRIGTNQPPNQPLKKPSNPVILIFDNELDNKNKPIKNFINHINIGKIKENKIIKEDFQSSLSQHVTANLFVLTHQSHIERADSEIEDLFNQNILNHKIGGKSFERNSNDNTKFYGKEIFSKYILKNYTHIDFSNFKPILTELNKILAEFDNN